jgi:signal transduction histidine kinase
VISDAARQSGGHGLRGMAERVHALGGTLEYGPRAGGGFRVRAVLPSADDRVGRRSTSTAKGGR